MPPDDYTPQPDDPVGGDPIVFRPATFARHAKVVDYIERFDRARYPRDGRGRTTRPSAGAWGYLAPGATISAASGLTLGTGQVALCNRSGTGLATTSETVTVYNSGQQITGAPSVGTALELDWTDGAFAVCQCGGPPPCSPCPIPQQDLTVCWYNSLSGNGSTPLIYDGIGLWRSACSNQLIYGLSCPAGASEFFVTYFLTGTCPTGQSQSCSYPGTAPFALTLTSSNCSEPFLLDFSCTVGSCVVLGDDGFSRFVVTDGSCPP